jgi:hypothetical protein
VEHVFCRVGQLSEVNLHPESLADMVSIDIDKVNKHQYCAHTYNPSLHDIIESTMRCSVCP